MVNMKADASRLLKRLGDLKGKLSSLGETRAELTPSIVLTQLCEAKGASLLAVMPEAARADIERRWRPKV